MGITVLVKKKKDARGKKISWEETLQEIPGTVYQNYPNYDERPMKWYRDEVGPEFRPVAISSVTDDPHELYQGGCQITYKLKKTLLKYHFPIMEDYLGSSWKEILDNSSDQELRHLLEKLQEINLNIQSINKIFDFSGDFLESIEEDYKRELWKLQSILEFGMFCQMVGHFGHILKWDY